ncbi:hypothetical protein ACFXJ8_39195 [Nonomuraea sp. NPDC059194]|uniref:hypothetical protein n=1 Tax=Nonomuraea sp. NPDC059194 TaxID=3346764 RepID=UPI003676B1D7
MFLKRLALAAAACSVLAVSAGPAFADPTPEQSTTFAGPQPIDKANIQKATPSGRVLSSSEKQELQTKIDAQLRSEPGGQQISPTEISYKGGSVIVTFPLPGEKTVSTDPAYRTGGQDAAKALPVEYWRGCPYGTVTYWKCLYDDVSWGGRMVQYKDFGTQNLPRDFYSKAESAVNTGQSPFERTHYLDIYSGTGASGFVIITLPGFHETDYFPGGHGNKAKSIGIRQ